MSKSSAMKKSELLRKVARTSAALRSIQAAITPVSGPVTSLSIAADDLDRMADSMIGQTRIDVEGETQ
jgi:hypothetical protein